MRLLKRLPLLAALVGTAGCLMGCNFHLHVMGKYDMTGKQRVEEPDEPNATLIVEE